MDQTRVFRHRFLGRVQPDNRRTLALVTHSRDISGRDDLLAWFGELGRRGFWLEELEVFGNNRMACAISVMGARRDGIDVSTRVVSVFDYAEGRQTQRWIYPDDLEAFGQIFYDRPASPGR